MSQHFECLVKMRATPSTLLVRVNTVATENAGMENERQSKCDAGKPETDTFLPNSTFNKNMNTSGPSKPIKLSIRHFATKVVMSCSLK